MQRKLQAIKAILTSTEQNLCDRAIYRSFQGQLRDLSEATQSSARGAEWIELQMARLEQGAGRFCLQLTQLVGTVLHCMPIHVRFSPPLQLGYTLLVTSVRSHKIVQIMSEYASLHCVGH